MHTTEARRLIPREPIDEFDAASPAGQFAGWERRRLLRELTARLTGFQMLILVLHYEDNLPIDQVARVLRVPESRAWKMHERIRRILATELARRGVVSLHQIL